MKKVVNEKGELVLARTPNMVKILNFCYAKMPIIAILETKSLQAAYHQAITDYLKSAYRNPLNRPWVELLLAETRAQGFTAQSFDQAANLILNSKFIKQ